MSIETVETTDGFISDWIVDLHSAEMAAVVASSERVWEAIWKDYAALLLRRN
ncbi:MAG: hypothetical protein ACXWNK_11030 [Vulcanimicrobiaceae bacterium]